MKLYDKNKQFFANARACKKPKFSLHRGRSWDCEDKWIDGKEYEFWFDSTWGANMYFEYNGRWYSIPVITEDKKGLVGNEYRRFYTKEGLKHEIY